MHFILQFLSLFTFISLSIGIIIGHFCAEFSFWIFAGVSFPLLASLLFFSHNRFFAGWIFFISLAGILRIQMVKEEERTLQSLGNKLKGRIIRITGTIKNIRDTSSGSRYIIEATLSNVIPASAIKTTTFYVYSRRSGQGKMGDGISAMGEFSQFQNKRNPGGTDWKNYFIKKNVIGKIYTKNRKIILESELDNRFDQNVGSIRKNIENIIYSHTDEKTGGLALALLIGSRVGLDPDLNKKFIQSGVVHVLALSGLHVGYIVMVLLLLTKIFRIPWGYDKILAIIGLIVFIFITGGKPSVIRGVVMTSCYLIAPVLGLKTNNWNPLGIAGTILLMANPNFLFEPGFLYSFMAVGSIFIFYPKFQQTKIFLLLNNSRFKLLKFTGQLFYVSLSAQIGTIPITVLYFHKIPLAGFIANIFVIPLIGAFVSLGIALIMFTKINILSNSFGECLWLIYQGLELITEKLGSLKYGNVLTGESTIFAFLSIIVVGILILMKFYFQSKKVFFAILMVWIIGAVQQFRQKDITDVIFLDVGQGDAVFIKFSNDENVLIDTGPGSQNWNAGSAIIVPTLNYLGVSKIDKLILTHFHADHTGGLPGILKGMKVDSIFINLPRGKKKFIQDQAQEYKIPIVNIFRGKSIKNGADHYLQILYPDSASYYSMRNKNDRSVSILTNVVKGNLLLTGDLEKPGFNRLAKLESELNVEYYKLPHHGSYTGTTREILDKINPKFIVISVGEKNKFNHPSPNVLEILDSMKLKIDRTDISGAIWLRSDKLSTWTHSWR